MQSASFSAEYRAGPTSPFSDKARSTRAFLLLAFGLQFCLARFFFFTEVYSAHSASASNGCTKWEGGNFTNGYGAVAMRLMWSRGSTRRGRWEGRGGAH